MEAGAAFLLLLIVIVLGLVGFGLWALAWTLRRRKLNPHEDKIDSAPIENGHARPEHRRVSNEQRTRSIPRR